MCGIIAIKRLDGKAPHRMLHKRYQFQKSRGQEGYGFVLLKQNKVVAYERSETEKEIMAKLNQGVSDEVIFHHRMPTSTDNLMEAAHPIRVSNDKLKHDYYLIHNGIIHEPEKWKDLHEQDGFEYTTRIVKQRRTLLRTLFVDDEFNDSEALAIELAIDLDKEGNGISVSGSIAFVMLQTDKEGNAIRLFWGRNDGSPLKINELAGVFRTIASEGQGVIIPTHKLYEYDYHRKTVSCRDYTVGLNKIWGFKYGYPEDDKDYSAEDSENTKYFQLLEKYDNLKKSYEEMLLEGLDDQKLLGELDDVEAEIADMEAEFDNLKLETITT